jgi:hypothetical protein
MRNEEKQNPRGNGTTAGFYKPAHAPVGFGAMYLSHARRCTQAVLRKTELSTCKISIVSRDQVRLRAWDATHLARISRPEEESLWPSIFLVTVRA